MAKEEKKSVFDVSKPGSTPPDSSAKPIIVSHKPMIKDPMMSEGNDKAAKNEPEETVQDMPDEKPAEKHVSKRVEPISESPETQTPDDNQVKEETKSAETTDTVSDDAAIVDTVVSKASDKNKKTKDAQDEAARKENIQKLIETKKYFVKVKAPKAKRNKRAVLVVLFVLLLGLFGIAVAADAELLPVDVPFDFIKKTTSVAPAAVVNEVDVSEQESAQVVERSFVAPAGWKKQKSAEFGLNFYTPDDWGVVDHNENACTKGHYLEIIPSTKSISDASVKVNPNLKKVKVSLTKEASNVQDCGSVSYFTPGIPLVESVVELETGWLKKSWLTFIGSEADAKFSSGLVTPNKMEGQNYDIPDDAETVNLNGKKVKIEITFDKGTYEETLDIATFESEAMKKTELYASIVNVLNSFQEIKN